MKKALKYLILLLLLAACKGNVIDVKEGPDVPEDIPQPGDLKILLIGNSYLGYNEFPAMFKFFCQAAGKKVFIGHAIVYGQPLDYHARSGDTYSKIISQKWDYVILEEGGAVYGYPDTHQYIFPPYIKYDTYNSLKILDNIVKTNNPSAKTILFVPWAYEDGTTWVPGYSDTYEVMQKKIFDTCMGWAGELNMIPAPVGWAFNEVMKTNKQLHYLYSTDSSHPSQKGSYLMGCVFYKTIFNESCKGNSYYGLLSRDEAEYFQKTATELVLE